MPRPQNIHKNGVTARICYIAHNGPGIATYDRTTTSSAMAHHIWTPFLNRNRTYSMYDMQIYINGLNWDKIFKYLYVNHFKLYLSFMVRNYTRHCVLNVVWCGEWMPHWLVFCDHLVYHQIRNIFTNTLLPLTPTRHFANRPTKFKYLRYKWDVIWGLGVNGQNVKWWPSHSQADEDDHDDDDDDDN